MYSIRKSSTKNKPYKFPPGTAYFHYYGSQTISSFVFSICVGLTLCSERKS